MAFFMVRGNEYVQRHLCQEELSCLLIPLEEIHCEWNKVLFAGDHELLGRVKAFVEARYYPGIYFVETDSMYYEIPAGRRFQRAGFTGFVLFENPCRKHHCYWRLLQRY